MVAKLTLRGLRSETTKLLKQIHRVCDPERYFENCIDKLDIFKQKFLFYNQNTIDAQQVKLNHQYIYNIDKTRNEMESILNETKILDALLKKGSFVYFCMYHFKNSFHHSVSIILVDRCICRSFQASHYLILFGKIDFL